MGSPTECYWVPRRVCTVATGVDPALQDLQVFLFSNRDSIIITIFTIIGSKQHQASITCCPCISLSVAWWLYSDERTTTVTVTVAATVTTTATARQGKARQGRDTTPFWGGRGRRWGGGLALASFPSGPVCGLAARSSHVMCLKSLERVCLLHTCWLRLSLPCSSQ